MQGVGQKFECELHFLPFIKKLKIKRKFKKNLENRKNFKKKMKIKYCNFLTYFTQKNTFYKRYFYEEMSRNSLRNKISEYKYNKFQNDTKNLNSFDYNEFNNDCINFFKIIYRM